jgi:hypothetical protein
MLRRVKALIEINRALGRAVVGSFHRGNWAWTGLEAAQMTDGKPRSPTTKAEKAMAADQRSADVFTGEAKRVASDVAKTAKLRALREARDAAGREASAPAPAPKPKTSAKTRSLRPGVRLLK